MAYYIEEKLIMEKKNLKPRDDDTFFFIGDFVMALPFAT